MELSRRETRLALGVAALVVLVVVAVAVVVGFGDEGDDTLSTSEFCERLARQQGLVETIGNLETAELQGEQPELDELAERAPAEIAPQMAELAASVQRVTDALATIDSGDVAAAEDALRPLQEDLGQAQAAGEAVETYARDRCGLDLRTGGTLPTTVPTSGAPSTDGTGTVGDEAPDGAPTTIR